MSAHDQVPRLLAMVPLLQRQHLTVEELAAEFQCKPAQIMKDLQTLWYCGPSAYNSSFMDINIEAIKEDPTSVITLDNADYLARPMRLTRAEASALLVALQSLPVDSRETADMVDRTIAKVEGASRASSPPAEVLGTRRQDPRVAQIVAAIEADQGLDIGYYVPTRDETTRRRVDPVAVFERDGCRYLDAWCHLAQARRVFRLDRIASLEVTEEPRTGADLTVREDDQDGFFDDWSAEVAVLELDAEAAWFVEYHPVSSVEELASGAIRAVLPLVNPRWLTQQVARLGGHARIIEPAELAEEVAQSAQRTLGRYAELSGSGG